jgi:maltooligosyltrehalose trehalohydrolase
VREGRAKEFAAFHAHGSPPDPQAEETFLRSKLDHNLRGHSHHQALWQFYRELIRLRKTLPALRELDANILESKETQRGLQVIRRFEENEVLMIFNFGLQSLKCWSTTAKDNWQLVLDSADTKWMGPGTSQDGAEGDLPLIQPQSVRLYQRS